MSVYGATCCRQWAKDQRAAIEIVARSLREARAIARGMYTLARRVWVWRIS
jgi:hypothetical protein